MPITDDNNADAKSKDQLTGILVLVGIMGALLFIVFKFLKK